MAKTFVSVVISFTFTVILSCYRENQVCCEAINVDPERHKTLHNVIDSYFDPQDLEAFQYFEPDADQISGGRSEDDESETSVPSAFRSLAPKLCLELQGDLAQNAASFIQCAILHARPITVCLKCVGAYNDTFYLYHQLIEASQNSTKCRDVFIGKDKLEIIEMMYGSVVKMWNQGNCNSCYETDESGSPNLSAVSNETLNFMQALKKVKDCFEGIKLSGSSNDTCTDCKALYEHLGSIYDSISKDMVNNQTEVVCADITDAMNVTHHIWNGQLKCKLFSTSVGYALFILTGCLSATPVLFYLAAKIMSNVETIRLVLPKRKQFVQDSTQLQM